MRIFITVVILVHGLIHLLGFLKSVKPQSVKELSQNISKQRGILAVLSNPFNCHCSYLFHDAGLVVDSRFAGGDHIADSDNIGLEGCEVWDDCKHHNSDSGNYWLYLQKF